MLVTDVLQSHRNFKLTCGVFLSQPNFSLSILQLLIPTTRSIQFLCSQAHILAGWHPETRLTLLNRNLLYNHFTRTTQKTQPLSCWEGVFTAPLHNNGSYSTIACVFVVARICLPNRCLPMNVYSDFTLPTFGRHVTI
jgi:hypothetical protein